MEDGIIMNNKSRFYQSFFIPRSKCGLTIGDLEKENFLCRVGNHIGADVLDRYRTFGPYFRLKARVENETVKVDRTKLGAFEHNGYEWETHNTHGLKLSMRTSPFERLIPKSILNPNPPGEEGFYFKIEYCGDFLPLLSISVEDVVNTVIRKLDELKNSKNCGLR